MRRHRCYAMDVDGTQARVHGDPCMSVETQEALTELVRAVVQMTPEQIDEMADRARARREQERR